MNTATFWLVVKAVIAVLPAIISMVQNGKIRKATEDEIISAFNAEFDERIAAAQAATPTEDEDHDPNNRSRSA